MSSPKVSQFVNSFQSFLKVLVSSNELTQNLLRKVEVMLFYLNRYPLDSDKMQLFSQNCGNNEFQEKFEKDNQLDVLIFGIKDILSKGSFLEQQKEGAQIQEARSFSSQNLLQYLDLPSTQYMTQSNKILHRNDTPTKQQEIYNQYHDQKQFTKMNNINETPKEIENRQLNSFTPNQNQQQQMHMSSSVNQQKSNNNLDSIGSQVEYNFNNQDSNLQQNLINKYLNNSNTQNPNINVSRSQTPSITNFDTLLADFKKHDNIAASPKNKANSFVHFDVADLSNRNSHEEFDKKSSQQNRIASANYLSERVKENEAINSNKQLNSPQKQKQNQSPDKKLNFFDNRNNYPQNQNSPSKNLSINEINNDQKRQGVFQSEQLLTEVQSLMQIMRSHTQLYKDIIQEYHDKNKVQPQKMDLSKKYQYRFSNNDSNSFYKLDLKQSMKQSLKNVMLYTSKDNRDASFQQIETDLHQKFQQTLNNFAKVDVNINTSTNKNLVNFMNSQQNQHPGSPQPESLSAKYMLDKQKLNSNNRNGQQSQPQTPLSFQSELKKAILNQQINQNTSPFNSKRELNQSPSYQNLTQQQLQMIQQQQNLLNSKLQSTSHSPLPVVTQQPNQISQQQMQQNPQSNPLLQQSVQTRFEQQQVLSQQDNKAYQNTSSQHQQYKELGEFIIQPQKAHNSREQAQFVRIPSRERNEQFGQNGQNNSKYDQSNSYSQLNTSVDNNNSSHIPPFTGAIGQTSLQHQDAYLGSQRQGSGRQIVLQQAPTRQLQNIYSLENIKQLQVNANTSKQAQDLNSLYGKDEVESPIRIPNQKGISSNKLTSNLINGQQKDINQKKHLYIDNQKIY